MTYKEMIKKYEKRGLTDYQLHTLDDLKEIHGLDVRELSGYSGLSENNKNLFNVTVLLFYNAHGLNGRLELKPVSVNYVQEERYISEDDDDVAIEIYLVDGDIVTKQLYSHIFEKGVSFDKCRKVVKRYLRFELCDSLKLHQTIIWCNYECTIKQKYPSISIDTSVVPFYNKS